MKTTLLVVAVAALYLLHQDIWFWRSSYLVFGFMPIGLFYQGCFANRRRAAVWLLVMYAWPSHLEKRPEAADTREDRRALIPAIVVFLYLAAVPLHRYLCFSARCRKRRSGRLLPREPFAWSIRVSVFTLRHEHDRVCDPRFVRPRFH
jgi:hypothetical protein